MNVGSTRNILLKGEAGNVVQAFGEFVGGGNLIVGGIVFLILIIVRRQIALELGAVVPIIRLRDNIQLNPNQYIIKIKGIQVSEGEILFDHYMAMNPGYVEDEIVGIPTLEPAFHLEAMWITESQRERAESLGYTVVDPPSIIATHLTEVIKQHLDELLTRQDVQNLIDNIKDNNKTLVDELVPKLLSVGDSTEKNGR